MRRAAIIAAGVVAFAALSLIAVYSTYRARHDGIASLIDAVRRRDLVEAKQLIAHGVNPRARLYVSFLDLALRNRDHEMTLLLLAHGADPNDESMGGWPIEVAAQHNDVEGLRILVAAGADVKAIGQGYGALRQAAAQCAGDAADFLLAQKAPRPGPSGSPYPDQNIVEACARCPEIVTRATSGYCDSGGAKPTAQ
ncbi:MAG: ankyrin repeat domain-containing protein [Deltaproteobacteria bacterium]|nr:ankyrin repeat domain-containing protein [Deltaproteobacteria bacterium]